MTASALHALSVLHIKVLWDGLVNYLLMFLKSRSKCTLSPRVPGFQDCSHKCENTPLTSLYVMVLDKLNGFCYILKVKWVCDLLKAGGSAECGNKRMLCSQKEKSCPNLETNSKYLFCFELR